jgi:hypothetical protein
MWESVAPGWEANAGMDADVHDAIAERAMQSGTKAAASEGGRNRV